MSAGLEESDPIQKVEVKGHQRPGHLIGRVEHLTSVCSFSISLLLKLKVKDGWLYFLVLWLSFLASQGPNFSVSVCFTPVKSSLVVEKFNECVRLFLA